MKSYLDEFLLSKNPRNHLVVVYWPNQIVILGILKFKTPCEYCNSFLGVRIHFGRCSTHKLCSPYIPQVFCFYVRLLTFVRLIK